jgi:predicted metal-binding membrane protein
MPNATVLERGLRRDRVLVITALVLVVVLSWAYVLAGAGMSMQDMPGMLMPMPGEPWTLSYAGLVLVMWATMMAAMMLPSAAPMILLYGTVARRQQSPNSSSFATSVFALGYLLVWAGFSVVVVAVQNGLEQAAMLSPMIKTTNAVLAGSVLIAAGLYQWSPLKQACLRRCRSPLEFLATEWRQGLSGAFTMGLRHGAYCVGCCWALMLLLFVGGVMNLAWIGGLALFVLVEKLAPAGHWVGRLAGAGLMVWGTAVLGLWATSN